MSAGRYLYIPITRTEVKWVTQTIGQAKNCIKRPAGLLLEKKLKPFLFPEVLSCNPSARFKKVLLPRNDH